MSSILKLSWAAENSSFGEGVSLEITDLSILPKSLFFEAVVSAFKNQTGSLATRRVVDMNKVMPKKIFDALFLIYSSERELRDVIDLKIKNNEILNKKIQEKIRKKLIEKAICPLIEKNELSCDLFEEVYGHIKYAFSCDEEEAKQLIDKFILLVFCAVGFKKVFNSVNEFKTQSNFSGKEISTKTIPLLVRKANEFRSKFDKLHEKSYSDKLFKQFLIDCCDRALMGSEIRHVVGNDYPHFYGTDFKQKRIQLCRVIQVASVFFDGPKKVNSSSYLTNKDKDRPVFYDYESLIIEYKKNFDIKNEKFVKIFDKYNVSENKKNFTDIEEIRNPIKTNSFSELIMLIAQIEPAAQFISQHQNTNSDGSSCFQYQILFNTNQTVDWDQLQDLFDLLKESPNQIYLFLDAKIVGSEQLKMAPEIPKNVFFCNDPLSKVVKVLRRIGFSRFGSKGSKYMSYHNAYVAAQLDRVSLNPDLHCLEFGSGTSFPIGNVEIPRGDKKVAYIPFGAVHGTRAKTEFLLISPRTGLIVAVAECIELDWFTSKIAVKYGQLEPGYSFTRHQIHVNYNREFTPGNEGHPYFYFNRVKKQWDQFQEQIRKRASRGRDLKEIIVLPMNEREKKECKLPLDKPLRSFNGLNGLNGLRKAMGAKVFQYEPNMNLVVEPEQPAFIFAVFEDSSHSEMKVAVSRERTLEVIERPSECFRVLKDFDFNSEEEEDVSEEGNSSEEGNASEEGNSSEERSTSKIENPTYFLGSTKYLEPKETFVFVRAMGSIYKGVCECSRDLEFSFVASELNSGIIDRPRSRGAEETNKHHCILSTFNVLSEQKKEDYFGQWQQKRNITIKEITQGSIYSASAVPQNQAAQSPLPLEQWSLPPQPDFVEPPCEILQISNTQSIDKNIDLSTSGTRSEKEQTAQMLERLMQNMDFAFQAGQWSAVIENYLQIKRIQTESLNTKLSSMYSNARKELCDEFVTLWSDFEENFSELKQQLVENTDRDALALKLLQMIDDIAEIKKNFRYVLKRECVENARILQSYFYQLCSQMKDLEIENLKCCAESKELSMSLDKLEKLFLEEQWESYIKEFDQLKTYISVKKMLLGPGLISQCEFAKKRLYLATILVELSEAYKKKNWKLVAHHFEVIKQQKLTVLEEQFVPLKEFLLLANRPLLKILNPELYKECKKFAATAWNEMK